MPGDRALAAVLVAAVLAAGAVAAPGAFGDDPSRRDPSRLVALSELPPEQRRLAEEAFAQVVCDCPNENWSKTLAMCPDGCAVPQKQEILQRVIEGWDVPRIVAEQVRTRGSKAAAAPGAGRDGTWLVVAAVGAAAAVAWVILSGWSRAAAERRAAQPETAETGPEADAVERELREID